jgi:hypothetical protein
VPVFRVELTDGRIFDVDADRQPTEQEILAQLGGGAGGGEAPPAPPEDESFVERHAATGVRALGGTAAGIIGAVPSPITTPAAAALGGLTELAAQGVEKFQGKRESFSLGSIAVEGGLAAIPFGKSVSIAKTAGKVAAVEAVGAQARSLAETGELAGPEQTALAAGAGALFGAGGAALERKLAGPAAEAITQATPAKPASEAAEQLPLDLKRPAEQFELFDDAGYVRPPVAELAEGAVTVEGSTARAGAQLVDAVKAEGKEAARLLGRTQAAAEDRRLYLQVGELFETGELDAPGLLRELNERGLSMPEYVRDYYLPSVKRGARQMQQLSELAKQLKQTPGMEDAANLLAKASHTSRFWDLLQKVEDTRRAMLIGQVKTGVRNLVSQGAASAVDLLEAGMTGGATGMRDQLEAMGRAFSRKGAAEATDTLLKYRSDLRTAMGQFEYSAPELIDDVPILRATIGKFTEMTTFANRWQEMFFRHAKFDTVIRQELRARGLDVAEYMADPRKLDDLGILDTAVERALEATFASSNPSGLGKIVNGAQLLRPISTFLTPFPRYMANAVSFIAKRNPLSVVRLVTESGRAKSGQVLAEAATGTMLLGGALALRSSDAAGERWYEVKGDDGKRYDLRGFAGPFAPYLFAADLIRQKWETGAINASGADFVEGMLSMNRLAGTAASVLGWLQGDANDPRVSDKIERIAGEWVGGFTVPFRTFKDALAITGDQDEATFRDTREDSPLLAATKQNLPGVGSQAPARPSITTGEPIRSDSPILSGVFGLNVRSINAVEAEMNTLGIKPSDQNVAPRTGVPKADRELYRRVGKLVAAYGPRIVATEAYQAKSPAERIIFWTGDGTPRNPGFFGRMRKLAKADLKETNPKLAAAIKVHDKLTTNQRRLLRERGVDVEGRLRQIAEESPETGATP